MCDITSINWREKITNNITIVGAFTTLISTMDGPENQVGNYGLEQHQAKWNRHIQNCPPNKRMHLLLRAKHTLGCRHSLTHPGRLKSCQGLLLSMGDETRNWSQEEGNREASWSKRKSTPTFWNTENVTKPVPGGRLTAVSPSLGEKEPLYKNLTLKDRGKMWMKQRLEQKKISRVREGGVLSKIEKLLAVSMTKWYDSYQ